MISVASREPPPLLIYFILEETSPSLSLTPIPGIITTSSYDYNAIFYIQNDEDLKKLRFLMRRKAFKYRYLFQFLLYWPVFAHCKQ